LIRNQTSQQKPRQEPFNTPTPQDFGYIKRLVHKASVRQLTCNLLNSAPRVVDLNIKTGSTLIALQASINATKQIGISSCQTTLNRVSDAIRQSKDLAIPRLICASPNDIKRHVQPNSSDCVIAHFMYQNNKRDQIIKLCDGITSENGLISFVSNTQKAIHHTKCKLPKLIQAIFYSSRFLQQNDLPVNHASHIQDVESHGFQIIDQCAIQKEIVLNSYNDIKSWLLNSAWTSDLLPRFAYTQNSLLFLYYQCLKLFKGNLFPIKIQTDISVILAKKP
tara:strand:- start:2785 stop:3618 length:834 start_codon:yes stop_codon:yes gene_type:complete